MAFIAVVDFIFDAQFFQHQHTADAEQIFLLDTVFPVSTIELVSDRAVPFAVHIVVGVEQIEFNATHIRAPYFGINHAAGVRHFKNQLLSVFVEHRIDGQLVEVLRFVVGNLLSIKGETLCKVAIAIQEANCCHIHTIVGCFFNIVAGKNAKTTGINLQSAAQAIFHAEIRHGRKVFAQGHFHIFLKVFVNCVDASKHFLVFQNLIEAF